MVTFQERKTEQRWGRGGNNEASRDRNAGQEDPTNQYQFIFIYSKGRVCGLA